MNKADAHRITTTGEIRTNDTCPCCGDQIYDCDCPLIMIDTGWMCTKHIDIVTGHVKQGEWPVEMESEQE